MTSKPLTKNGPNGISLFPSFFIRYKAYGKAINEANIGINPNDDGKVIRLIFPVLTEERRKELVKQTKKIGQFEKPGDSESNILMPESKNY